MKVITQYMGDPYIFFMLTKQCVMWYTSFRLQTQYICKTMPENFRNSIYILHISTNHIHHVYGVYVFIQYNRRIHFPHLYPPMNEIYLRGYLLLKNKSLMERFTHVAPIKLRK